jgi:hypothetical protein
MSHLWFREKIRSFWLLPPVAALLLTLGGALTPTGLDKPIRDLGSALKELTIAAAHPSRLYIANMMVLVGLGALGLSFLVIASLARDRPGGLAASAATVGLVAAFCGVIVNVLIGFELAAAATAPHVAPEAAGRVLVSATTSAAGNLVLAAYLGGLALAFVLMSIALWRCPRVSRWLAALFGITGLVAAAGPPGFVGVVMAAPFVVVMVLLAIRIRSDSDETSSLSPSPVAALMSASSGAPGTS